MASPVVFRRYCQQHSLPIPQFSRKLQQQKSRLQKQLNRKEKGSHNRSKAKEKVAKLHLYVANQRANFLHQLTSFLIKSENQTFFFEDLPVKNLLKNHHIAYSIADVAWGEFLRQMKYKCEWYGKNFLQCNRFDPSSKRCFDCGAINHDLTLSQREWQCANCGVKHDRDLNAARNVKYFGLEAYCKSNAGQEMSQDPERIAAGNSSPAAEQNCGGEEIVKRSEALKLPIETDLVEAGNPN